MSTELSVFKADNFTIEELVHPQILDDIGELNSWMRLDKDVLADIDFVRDRWGDPVYCNVDQFDSRGLRPPNDPDGSFYSSHKQGKAFDLVPANGAIYDFRRLIKNIFKRGEFKAINTIEHYDFTPTWVHLAKMNHSRNMYVINP